MRITRWLSLGTLLCSGCALLSSLQRSSDDIAVQAGHIADAIQGGQVDIRVGIENATHLAETRLPGVMRSLNELAQTAGFAVGNQARCTTDLLRTRVAASIRSIFTNRVTHEPPVVCGTDPILLATSAVLTQERRSVTFGGFDLPRTLTAWVLDGNGRRLADVSPYLAWNSPYADVLVLQEPVMRAVTQASAVKIVLFDGETVMSEVGIASARPACADEPNKDVSTVPIELRPARTTHGDGEFGGHGPLVTWGVTLQIDPTGRILQARLSYRALERILSIDEAGVARARNAALDAARPTRGHEARDPDEINARYDALLARVRAAGGALYEIAGDDTDMLVEQVFDLWVAPQGYAIVAIQSPTQFTQTYYDTNHDIDTFHPGTPIKLIDVVGDTDSNDLGRSGMKVNFDAIMVHIRQTTDCMPLPGGP